MPSPKASKLTFRGRTYHTAKSHCADVLAQWALPGEAHTTTLVKAIMAIRFTTSTEIAKAIKDRFNIELQISHIIECEAGVIDEFSAALIPAMREDFNLDFDDPHTKATIDLASSLIAEHFRRRHLAQTQS